MVWESTQLRVHRNCGLNVAELVYLGKECIIIYDVVLSAAVVWTIVRVLETRRRYVELDVYMVNTNANIVRNHFNQFALYIISGTLPSGSKVGR